MMCWVVSTGLLTLHYALSTAVTAFGIVLAAVALATAAAHVRAMAR